MKAWLFFTDVADDGRPLTYVAGSPRLLPLAGGHLMSWRPLAIRRAEWLGRLVDGLAARGWMVQHWRSVGRRRPIDP